MLSIREALQWLRSRNFTHIMVETNSQLAFNAIDHPHALTPRFSSRWKIVYQPANTAAHVGAQVASSMAEPENIVRRGIKIFRGHGNLMIM